MQVNSINWSALIALIILASSAVLCAPSASGVSSTASSSKPTANSGSGSSSSSTPATSATVTPKPTSASSGSSLASAASLASGSPSLVNLDTFDGKNPFADDSLWQIPVHLVRDLSAGSGPDNLAKSASSSDESRDDEESADEEFNGNPSPISGPQVNLQPSSSSSPAIISASTTDLKTAAGYHYPSHGHGGHDYGHHDYGHHGDSHGYDAGHGSGHHYGGSGHGADHYGGHGKYFQYASVPYPYAWEFGYRRGNPYHTIERYEHGKGPHFQTKVKWSDKHGGYGVHVWDYNHDDHHSHHYGGGSHYKEPSHYGHHGGHYGHYGHH